MRTRRHKQCLAGTNRHQADAAIGAVSACRIGVLRFGPLRKVAQAFVCRFAALVNADKLESGHPNLLEVVKRFLPIAIALDPNFDAAKDHLFAPSKINAKLDNIAVPHFVRLTLNSRLRQSYVVQESTGT